MIVFLISHQNHMRRDKNCVHSMHWLDWSSCNCASSDLEFSDDDVMKVTNDVSLCRYRH